MNQSAYAAAGVDIEAGDRAVELMKASVARTRRPEVLGGLGGFAGFFDASALKGYRHPVLASSTDGVGTKVAIAQAMDKHDTIGYDLIGMLVDDLVVSGAEPLFVTDYIATGKVVPERIAAIVSGIADACVAAGCSLVGGETAEHPGLLGPDEYDIAGATTGVVEKDEILGAHRVQVGDAVIGMRASGLHSNGYSLVRHVLLTQAGWSLDRHVGELGRTLGEELLEPTKVYALDILDLIKRVKVNAMSHITGGGLANNLARVMPENTTAVLERSSWTPDPIFQLVQQVGDVSQADVDATLNMGVGMVAILPQDQVSGAIAALGERGVGAWQLGLVEASEGAGAAKLV
ncbi:phosphoribosylformylglycinamidine cyclo-ligase [Tessaracoccus sp. HDW20]|uniref:phosphoribosylformylglycinamidine cyclo-ligase n=1 Tax=Tessaracoccus coleopterorum TaxID=2714950 RepID=UPI0018D4C337|nr:phosphoribosylformylglycinamidine cyclo-ligase [Tessaracoccus coleopterorum]